MAFHVFTCHPKIAPIKDDNWIRHVQKLKEAKCAFNKVGEDPLKSMIMIDALQRLGVDYHFREDIEAVLKRQYNIFCSLRHGDYDLYEVALGFRLLRQEGYFVSADVFNNFRNKEGKFDQRLRQDIKGLMGLYEASHLCIEGEKILDEARDFSGQLLKAYMTSLDHNQDRIVANTLKHPYHKSLARLMIKSFLNNFQGTNECEHTFVELAKMDFNIVQSMYQEEISQISKWWAELGLAKELKFVRDQPLKWFMWSVVAFPCPALSKQRIELAKPISLIYVIDDIFDLRGTLDELTLFTEVVNRWEIAAAERVPYYMKICLKALFDTTNEISSEVYKQYGWNPLCSLQRAWKRLCNAFLLEAKWFDSGHLPKTEEYLNNGIISSGVHVVLVHMYFLLGDSITEESVDVIDGVPGIVSSMATILRLSDDLGSAEDEDQDGYDGSYVECYLREHPGTSVHSAREHVMNIISVMWKRLNEECLSPNPFPKSFIEGTLNAARMVPLMYSYDNDHSLPSLKKHIKSLLFESITI